jgi:peptidoglycan hydrolase-like protein with peptidoglycan-binding domain
MPMDFITVARLAMRLLGNNQLLDKIKDMVPIEPAPPTPSQYKPGSVAWLQDSLNTLIAADLEVDGEYGPATIEAVKEYQRSVDGLEVDGMSGPLTMAAIVEDLEKAG